MGGTTLLGTPPFVSFVVSAQGFLHLFLIPMKVLTQIPVIKPPNSPTTFSQCISSPRELGERSPVLGLGLGLGLPETLLGGPFPNTPGSTVTARLTL